MIPRKPSKGDPPDLSSQTLSQHIDAVEDLRERQLAQMPGDRWRDTKPKGTVIKALNHASTVIPQYGCVELNGSRNDPQIVTSEPEIEDEFKSRIYFAIQLPTEWSFQFPGLDDNKVYGIAQEPINPDEVGDVLVEGVTQAAISFTDTTITPSHRWAKPQLNSTDLIIANRYGPFEVIWHPDVGTVGGTSYPYWCIVRLSMTAKHTMFWAKAQSDWVEGGSYPSGRPSVSCKNCDYDGGSEIGDPFEIYLPRDRSGITAGADPAVYTNDVIKYQYDHDGIPFCISEYLHMGKIKDIRIQGIEGLIPAGWLECDGSSQTGNAGTFDLHDFASTQQPVGGEAKVVARMARHISAEEPMASANEIDLIDGIGEPGGVVLVPTFGDADDSGGDHFAVEMGAYKTCAVMYIQRYK